MAAKRGSSSLLDLLVQEEVGIEDGRWLKETVIKSIFIVCEMKKRMPAIIEDVY